MDFGYSRWGVAQRVSGNSENICLGKSVIRHGAKSVSPCHIRAVARGTGKKKGQPRTVDLLILVEAGGFEPPSASTPSSALHV